MYNVYVIKTGAYHMPIINKVNKKTVRCGYCHRPGHNKSSCQQYASRIEELRENHGSDFYLVAGYDAKKAKRKASGKARQCSYCSEVGHNRKTCQIIVTHMGEIRAKNVEYRKQIWSAMVKHGIFTGAIITSDENTAYRKKGDRTSGSFRVPMVITRVMWENINVWEREYRYYSAIMTERTPMLVKPITDLGTNWPRSIGFPLDYDLLWNKMTHDTFESYNDANNNWYSRYKDHYFPTVISGVNAQKPPLGWLLCEDLDSEKALKEFFKKRKASEKYRPLAKGVTNESLHKTMREESGY